jgi:two-component system, chemotaxis family, chemotaxis protein CheY
MKLPKVLDLAAAITLHESILRDVQASGGVRVDASEVEALTLPCLQILLAAKRDAKVWIDQPSDAFIQAFADLGLDWSHGMQQPPEPAVESSAEGSLPQEDGQVVAVGIIEETASAVANLRILTIDDSKTMRDMLMLTLVDAGFDVIQAVDGKDGIDMLERENVDVVITDINMPRMDGYEVVRQLRARPEHKTTPILVLTTESEAEKKNIARAAGATGWLVKPFDPERLIATVRKVAC